MKTLTAMSLDYRNTNSLWCGVLVETLVRCGVTRAVISPGSRSAPLTFALAAHPGIEAIPVLDERSAGFLALGLAKQHHAPVVLVCTSGTAGANFLPAVIEAHEGGVPLLVLTADRPPEMRDCQSGQTIDQQKLYGAYVNFAHEVAVPEATLPMLRYLRQTVAHAVGRSLQPAGPVHLNCPFRDPLPPLADGRTASLKGKLGAEFFAGLIPPASLATATIPADFPLAPRGLIIAGPAQPAHARQYAASVELLAAKTGWPVLADSLSPLRGFVAPGQAFVTHYDVLARNERWLRSMKPGFVLVLGGWPISKPLRAWLGGLDVPCWLVSESPRNADALHVRTRWVQATVGGLAAAWPHQPADGVYTAAWTGADDRVHLAMERKLSRVNWMFEGKVAWLLSRHLPAETPLFVANSMPVRDLEYFWQANTAACPVYFNRGANGIDGTLSTALGIAHGGKRPAVLLTGDLALLHDANGFLSVPKFKGSLTIVLINNEGGGIFEHLPVAAFNPPFEEFFATPQQVSFAKLAAAHGVEYVRVQHEAHLTKLIAKLPKRGVRLLEVRTDRKKDAAFRKELLAGLAEL
jgi:2-succinyl-5-enolpyruvyl-6-hydroxy-3-cyclohexene-1-carboxylate synthase